MKKLFYTLSFVALLSIAGKSQTDKPAGSQEPAKKQAATAATHDAAATNDASVKKDEKSDQPKSTGTRMAINEKGVPASKVAKDKPKEEKSASPGQPAATDKK